MANLVNNMVDSGNILIPFGASASAVDLAAGGSVVLFTAKAGVQYIIKDLNINLDGVNFSGGGGDRNISITDNTSVYSVVPAATAQSLVNARWGTTDVPLPASVGMETPTTAGVNLVAKYSGGAADYTTGTLSINGIMQRI